MLRIIAGVIVGWIVMVVLVALTFLITATAMGGIENVLQPGTYWTTNTFNVIVLAGGFVAAILGGVVCGAIARHPNAALLLAGIVLAFGIGSALMNRNKPDPPPRTGPLKMEDMMKHGKEPNWFAFSTPLTGAFGLLIGSAIVGARRKNAPSPNN